MITSGRKPHARPSDQTGRDPMLAVTEGIAVLIAEIVILVPKRSIDSGLEALGHSNDLDHAMRVGKLPFYH